MRDDPAGEVEAFLSLPPANAEAFELFSFWAEADVPVGVCLRLQHGVVVIDLLPEHTGVFLRLAL